MSNPVFVTDHEHEGENDESCLHIIGQDMLTQSYFYCERGRDEHMPRHAWVGRSCDGGSNESCQRKRCEMPRLAKIHMGFAPVFINHQAEYDRKKGITVKTAEPAKPDDAIAVWDAYAARVRELLVQKSAYGNSWRKRGYMGNVVRILSKGDRLDSLVCNDERLDPAFTHGVGESVLDTLLDIGPLAAFAIANIEDGNRWGR